MIEPLTQYYNRREIETDRRLRADRIFQMIKATFQPFCSRTVEKELREALILVGATEGRNEGAGEDEGEEASGQDDGDDVDEDVVSDEVAAQEESRRSLRLVRYSVCRVSVSYHINGVTANQEKSCRRELLHW